MNTVQRIARNSFSLFLGEGAVRLLGILLTVFLARSLGAAEYGKYAFAVAFTSLFLIVADMGLGVLSIREIARDHQKTSQYLTTVSLSKLMLSLVMVGMIILGVNLLGYPPDTVTVVYIVGFTNVFASFSTFFRSIFRAFERMEYDALTAIGERLMVISTALVLLFQGKGLGEVVWGMLLAQALGFLFTLAVCLKKFVRPEMSFDFVLAWRLLVTALPFALTGVFDSLIFQADTVILSKMKGDIVVGWYSAAYRPIFAALFISAIFTGAVFPMFSRLYLSAREKLAVAYEKSFKLLVTLALPLGIGATLIAERLILFLYGEEFLPSVIALQVLVWAMSLIFLMTFLAHTLVAIDRQRVAMRNSAICAVLSLVLNLSLIPSLSYIGAAAANVIAQAVVLFLALGYLQKNLHRLDIWKVLSRPLLATIVMGGVIYLLGLLLDRSVVSLFLIILAGIVLYGLCLFLFRAFDSSEWQLVKGIFRRSSENL